MALFSLCHVLRLPCGELIMFTIIHSSNEHLFLAKIGAVSLGELYLHEEIVERFLEILIRILSQAQFFQHPIIVDEKSKVVLDGMHRVTALRRLQFDYIIAYLVDYNNPLIQIKRWCRKYELNKKIGKKMLMNILQKLQKMGNIAYDLVDIEAAEACLKKRSAIAYVQTHTNLHTVYCLYSEESTSILHAYRTLKAIEKFLESYLGTPTSYISDEMAKKQLRKRRDIMIIVPPQVNKDEVINYATQGIVFPPKTTRHIIPLRPFFVNIPMVLLKKTNLTASIEDVNRLVHIILSQKRGVKLHGKVEIDRFYEDDYIYVFI